MKPEILSIGIIWQNKKTNSESHLPVSQQQIAPRLIDLIDVIKPIRGTDAEVLTVAAETLILIDEPELNANPRNRYQLSLTVVGVGYVDDADL
jgi:hypothetical protein